MNELPAPSAARALAPAPSRLFVEVTSRCNLRCAMCVKHSCAERAPEGDMSPETFEALVPAFPHLEALVLNGVGEPLLHPLLERFVRRAKALMPAGSWVGFQTNGHLLDAERALALAGAGLDKVFLSVDAASPERFSSVRGGGSLGRVERALEALAEANARMPGRAVEVGAEFVLMRDTLRELPAVTAWLAERGVTRLVVSHILPYGEALADQPVFAASPERSVRFHAEWAARAKREGIDTARYFDVLWKYRKSPEEERIVEFVTEMTGTAMREDIPFHVVNLFSGEDLTEAERVFAQARETAWERGMSLALPPLRPRTRRPCQAVEQGGTFVAWDGRVAPCHFLWRAFECHFYGRRKQVVPRHFGHLPGVSLLEAWNGQAYREFRARAARGGFPHCPSCNVYPCEDIETTDLENDCYGEPVPCGDCLWSMGLLQCMGQELPGNP
ncbi:Putative mycofactocin radical SAM maturase MftC [Fundidesulfovibrio magnetotacticus]|uniref:Mycofactocin radical SAM maturase MftC n=1 Tax=Fundidesulfovibrio magnetotacticus TaxID=2730080 RepID=A0A6V8LZW7_9BACT|nr:radical SAM/SPASM family putative metalloenzyme maturase [Fundidesulfovibrio magnetotacticus]GFK95326.1 Putative mycofactocin radical SAM maturase MftC [Fundidesulfovibrio magnetotacticus]